MIRRGETNPREADYFGKDFTFRPEPAAASDWDSLFKPEQDVIGELLGRMDSGLRSLDKTRHQSSDPPELVVPNFLLSGMRGTGKTTVLRSVERAITKPDDFFASRRREDESTEETQDQSKEPRDHDYEERRKEAKQHAEGLRERVVWLDLIDMEVVPESANLLTTLLVRLHAALQQHGHTEQRTHTERVQDGDDAPDLDELIHDSALVWEGTHESDVYRRNQLEIDAAEVSTWFRKYLHKAILSVIHARTRPNGPEPIIVVPIDNADRSSKHLFQIVRLMHLVSSRSLWYMLAAGESDLDTFLERSYRSELHIAPAQSDDQSKSILAVARRQAASTLRTVIPPPNRIYLNRMTPEDALKFKLPDPSSSAPTEDLAHILQQIPIFEHARQDKNDEIAVRLPRHLYGMFEMSQSSAEASPQAEVDSLELIGSGAFAARVSRENPKAEADSLEFIGTGAFATRVSRENPKAEADSLEFTGAGIRALRLSIRRLIDFYIRAKTCAAECKRLGRATSENQKNQRQTTQSPNGSGAQQQKRLTKIDQDRLECVLYLIYDTLNDAISESELPEWATRLLMSRIVNKNHQDRVILDLRGSTLEWRAHSTPDMMVPSGLSEGKEIQSHVIVNTFTRFAVVLHDPDQQREVTLQPNVASWFMILHDLTRYAEEESSRVFDDGWARDEASTPNLVETWHKAAIWREESSLIEDLNICIPWPLPDFEQFYAFDKLARLWKKGWVAIRDKWIDDDRRREQDLAKLGHFDEQEFRDQESIEKARIEQLQELWVRAAMQVAFPKLYNWAEMCKLYHNDDTTKPRTLRDLLDWLGSTSVRPEVRKIQSAVRGEWLRRVRRWFCYQLPVVLEPEVDGPRALRLRARNMITELEYARLWTNYEVLRTDYRHWLVRRAIHKAVHRQRLLRTSAETAPWSSAKVARMVSKATRTWFRLLGEGEPKAAPGWESLTASTKSSLRYRHREMPKGNHGHNA